MRVFGFLERQKLLVRPVACHFRRLVKANRVTMCMCMCLMLMLILYALVSPTPATIYSNFTLLFHILP